MTRSDFHLSKLARSWAGAGQGPLDAALEQRRREGKRIIDLVTANPHEHGIVFPPDVLEQIAGNSMEYTRVYSPVALGLPAAREAIAAYYRRRGTAADADRIALTPGTSQAYFYALRLLADAGREVLVPSPGYPLFDDLCAIAGVDLRKYHLRCDAGRWWIDPEEIEFQCTERTRAIMAVSPHNPTGMMVDAATWRELGKICRRRGLAMVVDEVFCECVAGGGTCERPVGDDFPLLITLNGFSKMLSLPGWKIGWMKVDGDGDAADGFLRALEHLADTFLPVPDMQQAMIAPLMVAGDAVMAELKQKYDRRRTLALELLKERGWSMDPCPAGVYLCVRLNGRNDESFVLDALAKGVLIHPGYFYDLPDHWVMTCVAREEFVDEGLRLI